MPDPAAPPVDAELRAHVERALGGHYELDCEIGRGGMGIVYRARDKRLKRTVAIKVLPPELAFRSEIRSRFLREAETAAGLAHPNIVPIYSVDEADGIVFFVMACVTGDNLAKRLHDHGVLPAEEVRRILCEVGEALDFAHDRGVVHRDIKPDNILLDAESGRAMVTDFGIARAVTEGGDSRLTATGMAIGTPAYMSPEQAAGEREIDGRSDLYSLGVVAYQMLAGEPPFVASSTPAMLVKHLSERPVPIDQRRSDLPPALARAIMMCLEKDPASRFPSASALVEALKGDTIGAWGTAVARPSGPLSSTGTLAPPPGTPSAPARLGTPAGGAMTIGDLSAYEPRVPSGAWRDRTALTADEEIRANHPDVVKFRKSLGPYLFVNAVIVLASIFGAADILIVTVIWSIVIAYKYAKLWGEGFDWRDVFRQPRERELIDVADEGIETVRALVDRDKRQALRERRREQRASELAARPSATATMLPRLTTPGTPSARPPRAAGGASTPSADFASPATPTSLGAKSSSTSPFPPFPSATAAGAPSPAVGLPVDQAAADRVHAAKADCDAIIRGLDVLPKAERDQLDYEGSRTSAIALAEKVRQLTLQLAEVDRDLGQGALPAVDAEIDRLHDEANPLDEDASEARVRRLVALKRHRRALLDLGTKRDDLAQRVDTCAIALRTMRDHVTRLSTARVPSQSTQSVTQLVQRALHLAENVEGALAVAGDSGRASGGAARGADR